MWETSALNHYANCWLLKFKNDDKNIDQGKNSTSINGVGYSGYSCQKKIKDYKLKCKTQNSTGEKIGEILQVFLGAQIYKRRPENQRQQRQKNEHDIIAI